MGDKRRVIFLLILAACFKTSAAQDCPRRGMGQCCPGRRYNLNLETEYFNTIESTVPQRMPEGVELLERDLPFDFVDQKCSQTALFLVNFHPVTRNGSSHASCVQTPRCGRRMLRIDLVMDTDLSKDSWLFDVGDVFNHYDNASSSQRINSLVRGLRGRIMQWSGRRCGSPRTRSMFMRAHNVSRISLFVSHTHLRVRPGDREAVSRCAECQFDLNRNPVTESNSILVAVNRAAAHAVTRLSHGICRVGMRWLCPRCIDGQEEYEGFD